MPFLTRVFWCAIVLAAAVFRMQPAEAANLETLPIQAPAGASVIARGDRYQPGQPVELRLFSREADINEFLGDYDADDRGRLVAQYNIPRVPTGRYSVRALDASGVLLATGIQEVTASPNLVLDPAAGPPGTAVAVSFGPVPAGTVELHFGGLRILGPLAHAGGEFRGTFQVPAFLPEPFREPTDVQAISRSGVQITAAAQQVFEREPADTSEIRLLSAEVPRGVLRGGQPIRVTGQLALPAWASADDITLTLVWITTSGTLIPINHQPIQMDGDGRFTAEATAPSLASGAPLADIGATDALGMVYKLPGYGGNLVNIAPVEYHLFENQPIKFRVFKDNPSENPDVPPHDPLVDAVIRIYHNAALVPPGYEYEPDSVGDAARGIDPALAFKHAGSVLYHGPNQFLDAWQQVLPEPSSVTGCELTLDRGQTDANGEFTLNTLPILNYLFDYLAYKVNKLDINTTLNGPGPAEFSANVNALHLDHGLANANGACSGQRFDFQFHAEGFTGGGAVDGEWRLRDGLDGDYTIAFDPDDGLDVPLPEIQPGECDFTTPAQPYMPGLTTQETVKFIPPSTVVPIRRFGALWSFPDTNGATFNMLQPPQVRLPHADDIFGALTDVKMYFGNELQGELVPDGITCSQAGVEYVIDLPQLASMPAQIVQARITGIMLDQPFERELRIEIKEGPGWIENDQDFETRTINWSPETIVLTGVEPDRPLDASVNNVPQGIDKIDNDQVSSGTVRQVLKSTGASTRERIGVADAQVSNEITDPAGETTKPVGNDFVTIGSPTPITVLDTGRIPLFRYAWGIWPIATATVGADIWMTAEFLYHGMLKHTDSQVLMDLITEATANLGLDAWINVSAIMDVVSVTGFALPQISLSMPIVIEDNQFDSDDSQPCFRFLLDMGYAVKVGWCPFCVQADGETNLVDEKTEHCPDSKFAVPLRAALPEPPATDRTSIAVDGLGEAMAVWGDETGSINVQILQNGLPTDLVLVPAAPGAMGVDNAYLDADKAVMVWAQSSLQEADFFAFEGDPGGVIPFQHLVYRTWDGNAWSETMNLTLPTTGDGGVVLAACPASDPSCPPGGEVLAVWVNDAAADIGQHDLRLRYAFFDGLNWTTPQPVDPSSTAKDLQPAATYLDGEPVVVWVRNPGVIRGAGGVTLNLMQRRLAYRFLRQSAGVLEPVELPLGVSWPTVSGVGTSSLSLAYTVATEPDAFLGTRQSLHTALGTQCFQGECDFSDTERKDDLGRRMFAESPRMTTTDDGTAVVSFRHLGTDDPRPGDPPGVLSHTGALAQISFELLPEIEQVTNPVDLSFEHAVNWHLDAVYDPVTDQVMTTAVQPALLPAGLRAPATQARPVAGTTRNRLGNGAVTVTGRALLPDFQVISAQPARDWIAEGESIQVTVAVRNNGTAQDTGVGPALAASWDGPAGVGLPASEVVLQDLTPGGAVLEVVLDVALPDGFHADEVHDLHLTVNPLGAIDESDGGNNQGVVSMGALPVPQHPRVLAESGDRINVIHWDPVDDPRVTGYRVYRTNPDGTVMAVGSSYVAGFADFSAYSDQPYEYLVVSHSGRMMESAPSEAVPAITFGEGVFRDGFEPLQ